MGVKDQIKLSERFVILNGLPVKVQCIGKDLDENPKDLLLFIPGNPGGVHFYTEFCKIMYKLIKEERNREMSIWIIGHAGIDPCPNRGIPKIAGHETAYSLKGQTLAKKQFVDEYVPRGCNLYLMGHSIGVKMALDTFRYVETNSGGKNLNVMYLYGLFPVFERMLESPAGSIHSKMFTTWKFFILWAVYLISLLPSLILTLILYFMLPKGSSDGVVQAAKGLIDYRVIEKVFYLGASEIRDVRNLKEDDYEFLSKNTAKIRLYYGTSDQWVPLRYCYELKTKIENMQVYVCKKKIPHAFTLGHEEDMAELMVKWIKEVF